MKINVTHDKKLTFNFRKITLFFICIYVLTVYLGHINGMIAQIGSLCLMGMAAFAAITVIVERKMQINPYLIWYALFLLLCAISALYTLAENPFSMIYSLIVVLLIGWAFCVAVRETRDIELILMLIVIGSTILMIYLFASGYIEEYEASDESGKRFGNELTGNANSFAVVFMIAACSSIYFIFSKKKILIKIVYSVALYLQMYGLILAGSRKNILIPFILIYIMLILQKNKKGKRYFIIKTVCAVAVVFLLYQLVINVPFLYDNIGYRFETVIDYGTGVTTSADASAMEREAMREKAVILWEDSPIVGNGLHAFATMGGFGVYSHNNLLELMCNNGFIGAFLYYSFYVYLVAKLLCNKNDESKIKNFFIAFVVCEVVFEYGEITYYMVPIQIMIALAAVYFAISKGKKEEFGNGQSSNAFKSIEK